MGRRLLAAIALLSCFAFCAGNARAQDEENPEEESAPAEAPAAPQPQPEAPQPVTKVEVKDGLLSVDLVDAPFASVINEIAGKSGFSVTIDSAASGKKLTTKFSNVELESGITRLLSLLNEKSYLIRYNTDGKIAKLEILKSEPAVASAGVPPTAAARPLPFQRPGVQPGMQAGPGGRYMPPFRRRRYGIPPQAPQPAPPAEPAPEVSPPEE